MKEKLCKFASVYEKMLPFWSELSEDDRDYICRNSSELTYPKGNNIHGGMECTGVVFVKRGTLRLYIMSESGKEVTLYRLYAGDMCMLSASCVIEAITFDVMLDAEEESECCVINGKAFSEISEKYPNVKIFALETAVSRFSDVIWVLQQVLFMSMDKRLAVFLLDESTRTGSDTVSLTHEQIAKYMSSAREVVSRMVKYFVSEGLVESSRKGIRIIDKKRLYALTSGEN